MKNHGIRRFPSACRASPGSSLLLLLFFSAFIVGALFGPAPLFATNYYVDYVGGNDNNSGLSAAVALHRCPGDDEATGRAATIMLGAGDVVHFKGGTTYAGKVTIRSSGSLGSPIIYDGNMGGEWGVGRAMLNLRGTYYQAFIGQGKDYITIQSFEITAGKRPAGDTTKRGYIRDAAGKGWSITDCVFSKSEGWDTLCPQGSDQSVYSDQVAISLYGEGTIDTEIARCEFFAFGGDLIELFRTNGLVVQGCNFGGISRGQESGYFSVALRVMYNSRNIIVRQNSFHDGWQYEGDDAVQRCHAGDWIHIYGNTTALEYPHDILFEKNLFYNDKVFASTHGTAFTFMETQCHDIVWRNNVFINPHAGNGSILLQDGVDNISILNNTFVSYPHGVDGAVCLKIGLGTANNVQATNNIFVQLGTASPVCVEIYDSTWQGVLDYNSYYKPQNPAEMARRGSTWHSFSSWQALGFDAHSNYGNPQFVQLPASALLSGSGDYHLTSQSSGQIDKGKTQAGFRDDRDGLARPKGAAWDIGAYEFSGSQVQLNTPENLRIKN
jgi:hypothetical protein